MAGIDLVEDPDNYVFITGVDQDASNLAATNFKANAIFLDGTMQTIEVNGKKSNFNRGAWEGPLVNRWFTYTLNSTTNLYTVDEVNDVIRTKDSDGNYTVDADTVRINTTTANKNDAGSKWLHSNSVKLAQFATKNVDAVNPNKWDDYAGVQENENGDYKIGLKRVSRHRLQRQERRPALLSGLWQRRHRLSHRQGGDHQLQDRHQRRQVCGRYL